MTDNVVPIRTPTPDICCGSTAVCSECPLTVPDSPEGDAAFDTDLLFIAGVAQRLMLNAISKLEWNDFGPIAGMVLNEADTSTALALMRNATIEVSFPFVEAALGNDADTM